MQYRFLIAALLAGITGTGMATDAVDPRSIPESA